MNARDEMSVRDEALFILRHGGLTSEPLARELLDNYRAELLAEAAATSVEKDTPAGESTPPAATIEYYPGELAMLRGLLGVIRATATHGGGMDEVRRLLAEHASDEQAAYTGGAL
ncbi:hypothetical protein ACFU98_10830 [Streptomyces sp. NPDC057575]|uniref:hypothetical protein n=1 Tax=unclassified Streptomyces TaxID=2593676 RepID=UPI0036A01232